MLTTVEKVGDKFMLHIPEEILRDMQAVDNETVDVFWENQGIIIKKRHKTTEERLKEFYGDNYNDFIKNPDKYRVDEEEISWGQPVGAEVW